MRVFVFRLVKIEVSSTRGNLSFYLLLSHHMMKYSPIYNPPGFRSISSWLSSILWSILFCLLCLYKRRNWLYIMRTSTSKNSKNVRRLAPSISWNAPPVLPGTKSMINSAEEKFEFSSLSHVTKYFCLFWY